MIFSKESLRSSDSFQKCSLTFLFLLFFIYVGTPNENVFVWFVAFLNEFFDPILKESGTLATFDMFIERSDDSATSRQSDLRLRSFKDKTALFVWFGCCPLTVAISFKKS